MEKEKYQRLRQQKSYIRNRLLVRTKVILDFLKDIIKDDKIYYIVDIGTFDGFLLSKIKQNFYNSICIGIDNSFADNLFPSGLYINADALSLPLKEASFDIAIASAVIEHIKYPELFLSQINRILKIKGYLILTYPNPFFDYISTKLKDTGHIRQFTFSSIKKYLNRANFSVLKFDFFLLSPFPKSQKAFAFENFIRKSFLKPIFFNRIILAQKTN